MPIVAALQDSMSRFFYGDDWCRRYLLNNHQKASGKGSSQYMHLFIIAADVHDPFALDIIHTPFVSLYNPSYVDVASPVSGSKRWRTQNILEMKG